MLRKLQSIALPRYLIFLFLLSCLLGAASAQTFDDFKERLQKESSADKAILRWLAETITVSGHPDKKSSLKRRREPVRAHIDLRRANSDPTSANADALHAVEVLSEAFGLTHKLNATENNLLIFVANNIADGDKPSNELLKRLGVPENKIEFFDNAAGWSTGCGTLNMGDGKGNIIHSIVVADRDKISGEKLQQCIVGGIINAFGLRVRADTFPSRRAALGPYVILGRLLDTCGTELENLEKEQPKEVLNKTLQPHYAYCVLSKLKGTNKTKQ